MNQSKVMVAISGGVDSSTAAALLLQQGYDCCGVFMITHDRAQHAQRDAREVSDHLGIKLHILDLKPDFEKIISYFVNEYQSGRTPNPCVFCNKTIKFGVLWDFAQKQGCDYIATGHYAKIQTKNGVTGLYHAHDISKDQSYVLSMVNRSVLDHILLPVADLSKEQTRCIASQFDLPTEHKEDSQEICFIPDNDYAAMLETWCPGILKKGSIIDTQGNTLGEHEGICKYTIGQRRGLKIAMGEPVYVVRIDADDNTVTLGSKEDLMSQSLIAENVNWLIDPPAEPFNAKVKIRYNHKGAMATVLPCRDDKTRIKIEFKDPISAVTPGQASVMYIQEQDDWKVAGGGWICRSFKE